MKKKIILKNSNKWQTIEITYDGLNFNQKFIQHGAMLIILSQMESVEMWYNPSLPLKKEKERT